MSNKSVIDEAIQQMQQKMADSRGKRTGDYRIGLDAAINILENLRDMHKKEIDESYSEGYQDGHETAMSYIEQYYETQGGNNGNNNSN